MDWDDQKTDELCEALLSLQTKKEMKRFLRDLMTEEEIVECAQRWWVARMLDEGIVYETIQAKTGLSSTTVARISHWLRQGTGGYRIAIDRLKHHPRLHPEKRPA